MYLAVHCTTVGISLQNEVCIYIHFSRFAVLKICILEFYRLCFNLLHLVSIALLSHLYCFKNGQRASFRLNNYYLSFINAVIDGS